jgi:acyl-CoA oxidase
LVDFLGFLELGHGSFIRGLETTATFDEKTDEFVLNSPTLTSMKWWPGNLGKSVNHCVVMAQLIIKGKEYGLHAFIVPLRNRETHLPLPGVSLGDIGPKYGYEGNDNGFLILKHVRIPRDNMLMRHSKVDRQGNYTKPPHAKIGYATMVLIRASIVGDSGLALAKAVTIATRYSVVRKQFFSEGSPKEEVRVIDYQTQQQKLFPLLAQAFMLHFTGNEMRAMYQRNYQLVNKGDVSMLPELHATSSCLKALSSTLSCEGMEVCRKALGGHGYSKFSGSKFTSVCFVF